jgi:hypothetical protein
MKASMLKDYWFPIAAIVSMAAMWGGITTRISADETNWINIKDQTNQMSIDITSIKVDTSAIKQSVIDIDKQLK